MKSAAFNYHRPGSVDEALAMQAAAGEGARFIAGGQSLVPMMALRLAAPTDLIDLNTIDQLSGISRSATHTRIGAMTRQEDLAVDQSLCTEVPAMKAIVDSVGHPGTRTRGTIGGSLCHADPSAELPALLLAVGADVILASAGGGTRQVAVEDFFGGHFETTIGPNEVLTEIRIPHQARRRMGFDEVALRSADFAIAGAIVSANFNAEAGNGPDSGDGDSDDSDSRAGAGAGELESIRVVTFALGDRPQRLREVEAMVLESNGDAASLGPASQLAEGLTSPTAEPHLSERYKRQLGVAVVRRALQSALGSDR